MIRVLSLVVLQLVTLFSLDAQEAPKVKATMAFQNGYWVLNVETSNAFANQSLKARYGDKAISALDSPGVKNKLRDYVSQNVKVTLDSTALPMKPFNVELNSAKGSVKMISERFEKAGAEISVQFSCYTEQSENTIALTVKDDESTCRETLSKGNEFAMLIKMADCAP